MHWGHVLAAADDTTAGLQAVRVARALAGAAGLRLSVVTVLPPGTDGVPAALADCQPLVAHGVPGIEIVRVAEELQADCWCWAGLSIRTPTRCASVRRRTRSPGAAGCLVSTSRRRRTASGGISWRSTGPNAATPSSNRPGTDAAAAQAQAARHRYEAAKVKLFYQTSSVFHEFAYLAKAVDIAKENLELMKRFEQVAREKYRTAESSHPDVVRARIELATMEDDLISMTKMRRPIIAQLNAVMNQPADKDLPWPKRSQFNPVETKSDIIADQIRSANPELAAMHQQVIASRKMVDLAKKRYWPDVGLGIEVDNMPNNGSEMQNPVMAMITINLPIWVVSYSAGVKQAQAETAMARREKQQTEFDLIAQSEQIIYEMDDNLRKVRLYENVLIPKAKEMIEVTEQAYRTNTVDFMTLLDAEQKLLKFQLMYERSLTNYLQKQAELEMLTGQPLFPGKANSK